MLQSNHTYNNLWLNVHCVDVVVSKIAKKRKLKKIEKLDQSISECELSVAKSEKENIRLFCDVIQNKGLRELGSILLSDMYKYKFDESSSVVRSLGAINPNKDLELLQLISLLQHSFGVLNCMIEDIGLKFGLFSDFFFIVALVHDFGKSLELKRKNSIDLDLVHHEASAIYLNKTIGSLEITAYSRELLSTCLSVISAHHSPEKEKAFHQPRENGDSEELAIKILKHLKNADSVQRLKELELLNDI